VIPIFGRSGCLIACVMKRIICELTKIIDDPLICQSVRCGPSSASRVILCAQHRI
jgi:hypothetical protein